MGGKLTTSNKKKEVELLWDHALVYMDLLQQSPPLLTPQVSVFLPQPQGPFHPALGPTEDPIVLVEKKVSGWGKSVRRF